MKSLLIKQVYQFNGNCHKYYLLEHVFLHFKTSSLVRDLATNREVLRNVTAVDWKGKMTSIDFSSFIFYRNNKSLVSKNISARSRSMQEKYSIIYIRRKLSKLWRRSFWKLLWFEAASGLVINQNKKMKKIFGKL